MADEKTRGLTAKERAIFNLTKGCTLNDLVSTSLDTLSVGDLPATEELTLKIMSVLENENLSRGQTMYTMARLTHAILCTLIDEGTHFIEFSKGKHDA